MALLEAVWEPAITPQVERLVEAKAVKAKARLVPTAQRCLEEDKGGEAYHCLVELQTWWPWLRKGHSLEVVGLFSKMQSYAQEAFMQATRQGDKAAAEEIRAFAVQFDDLRLQFEGRLGPLGAWIGAFLDGLRLLCTSGCLRRRRAHWAKSWRRARPRSRCGQGHLEPTTKHPRIPMDVERFMTETAFSGDWSCVAKRSGACGGASEGAKTLRFQIDTLRASRVGFPKRARRFSSSSERVLIDLHGLSKGVLTNSASFCLISRRDLFWRRSPRPSRPWIMSWQRPRTTTQART